jgi:hypothetical protein
VDAVQRAAARFTDHVEPIDFLYGALGIAGAIATAAVGLFGRSLRQGLPARIREPTCPGLRRLRHLHTGEVGDYVAWWTAGASLLGPLFLIALT